VSAFDSISKEDCISVLKLSKMWYFRGICRKAEERLAKMDLVPEEKISLGREYSMSAWFLDGLTELITSRNPPTHQQCKHITLPTTVTIFHLREEHNLAGLKINTGPDLRVIKSFLKARFKEDVETLDAEYRDFYHHEIREGSVNSDRLDQL
jgi:hypothetical protein